jgi:hypothetical protein
MVAQSGLTNLDRLLDFVEMKVFISQTRKNHRLFVRPQMLRQ